MASLRLHMILLASCVSSSYILLFFNVPSAFASEPQLLSDFFVPPNINVSSIDASFFTFTGLRDGVRAPANTFKPLKMTSIEFPVLTSLGVSMALLQFRPKTINPPHTHPRGTEILYVLKGILHVGLIDTNNKLFTQILHQGDVFVFPKGLPHFQINRNGHKTVRALAAFSSSSPGTVPLPATLFGSGISDDVLHKAFKVSEDTLKVLKAPFAKPI